MDPKEQEYERVRQAMQEQVGEGEGGAKYMPHDVVAACDLAVEDDRVQRIRRAASLPHPEEVPVELSGEDVSHLLAQLDAGLQSYQETREQRRLVQQTQFAQSPAGIVARLNQPAAPTRAAGDNLPKGEQADFSKGDDAEGAHPTTRRRKS